MKKYCTFTLFNVLLVFCLSTFGNETEKSDIPAPKETQEANPQSPEYCKDLIHAVIQWGAHVPGAVVYDPNGDLIEQANTRIFSTLRHSPHLRTTLNELSRDEQIACWRALVELLTPSLLNALRRLVPLDNSDTQIGTALNTSQQEIWNFLPEVVEIVWVVWCIYESMHGSSLTRQIRSSL